MQKLLCRLFIKDYKNIKDSKVRAAYGSLAGIVGIVSNLLLALLKIIVGIFAISPAIIADGINNLSDGLSSIVTIIGFKLSTKKADADHPFGHQRIEYITGLIISFIILFIGFTLGKESVEGIILLIKHEQEALNISNIYLVMGSLIVSILVKLWQSIFYTKMGKAVDSQTLIANSKDSLNDCITTSAVICSTLIYIVTKEKVNIDCFASLVVSIFILISSIGLIKDTVDPLLGVVPSDEQIKEITDMIKSYDGVLGIHDFVMHSYGPNMNYVTCHVEVSSDANVLDSHDMIDCIEKEVGVKLGVDLTIHMDPIENNNEEVVHAKEIVKKIVKDIDPILNIHDFRIVKGPTHTNVLFDVVSPYNFKYNPKELKNVIGQKIKEYNETWFAVIQVDEFYNRLTND